MVLRNRPTLIIGTERLACLNSPPGVQLGTLAYHAAGPGFEPRVRRACCARFFLHPPFLPPSGDSFFRTFPTNPAKVLGLIDLQPVSIKPHGMYEKKQHSTCLFPLQI